MPVQMTLMCGLPGAGKSTLARRLEDSDCALRLAVDEWIFALELDFGSYDARRRVESLQLQMAAESLRHGRDVILDWGFWHRQQRDDARRVVNAIGARSRIFVWRLDIEELWSRIETRNRGGNAPHVTKDQLIGWAPYFEPLDDEEVVLFDEVVWVES